MKICVFGSASDKIDRIYIEKTYELCFDLAKRGHSLVFGAGGEGLMGAAARGFRDGGGKIHGVIPKFFDENGYEAIYREADVLTFTDTMAERKKIMEDDCEAFIIVPGGIGTFEEFFEILTLKQLGRHAKAIAIYNVNGYYDVMSKMLKNAVDQKFVNAECYKLAAAFDNKDEIIKYVENYSADDVKWSSLKRNG